MSSGKRKSLGRGLDALLSTPAAAVPAPRTADGELRTLGVERLQPGRYQPRTDMRDDSLQELADSIRTQGVVQPIVVRPVDGDAAGQYEIIAGERRWRASQLAGLDEVPVIVRDVPDEKALAMSLIENIQREDLNPLEEARALERLVDEFGLTHGQAAEAVGRSRSAVSNLVRLLELNDAVKALLEGRELGMGHARALLALPDGRQAEAARLVVRKNLSARETERLVKRMLDSGSGRERPAPQTDNPDVLRLEQDLGERLGARVRINQAAGGGGKLTVSYNSLEELDGILAHIR